MGPVCLRLLPGVSAGVAPRGSSFPHPYHRPPLVSDLPWEGAAPQSPSLSGSEDSGSPQHHGARDRKVIPLKMCFAARNLSMPDLENR